MRIFKSKWFQRFAEREELQDVTLLDAIDRANKGQIDADLGGGVIKQRIARREAGKSGGYRTIILFRMEHRAFFVYGLPKNKKDNIGRNELDSYKEIARRVLSLTNSQLAALTRKGDFLEIEANEQKVQD